MTQENDKDFNDLCNVVTVFAGTASHALDDDISIDTVIQSLAAVLGAMICQKNKIIVKKPAESVAQTVKIVTDLIISNRTPVVPDPSSN